MGESAVNRYGYRGIYKKEPPTEVGRVSANCRGGGLRSPGEASTFTVAAALGGDFAHDGEDDGKRHGVKEVDAGGEPVVDTDKAADHECEEDPDGDGGATGEFVIFH